MEQRILRRAEVQRLTGVPRSTMYLKISQGEFPKPVKLWGEKASGWLASEIEAWQQSRIQVRDTGGAK